VTRAVLAVLSALLIGGAIESACSDRSGTPAAMPVTRADGGADLESDSPADADADADAGAGASDAASVCPALCAKVDGAGCADPQPCAMVCEATLRDTCGDVYLIWARCAAQQPASSFGCDSRNQAALDATLCAEELRTFGDCLLFGG
jgi:hypothetical protein